MKSNEGKLIDEVERKTKELSRIQEELLEYQKAKQLDSLPTSLPMEANNVSINHGTLLQLKHHCMFLSHMHSYICKLCEYIHYTYVGKIW